MDLSCFTTELLNCMYLNIMLLENWLTIQLLKATVKTHQAFSVQEEDSQGQSGH